MDLPVRIWWLSLSVAAVINLSAWVWSFRVLGQKLVKDRSLADRHLHLWLSLVYVVVCGFRGVLPRADVQRICLVDSFFSSVAVGRSVATVAELACVLQWSLLLAEYGRAAGSKAVVGLSRVVVVLIVWAECWSWYAVLTTNYLGNTIEESSWTLMASLIGLGMVLLLRRAPGPALKQKLIGGLVGCLAYVTFMITVDVHTYFTRWQADTAAGKAYFGFSDGWHDLTTRWVVTGAWADWSTEVAWMTL